jgi:hypothetical protein
MFDLSENNSFDGLDPLVSLFVVRSRRKRARHAAMPYLVSLHALWFSAHSFL